MRQQSWLLASFATQIKSHHSNATLINTRPADVALVLEAIPASSTGNFETLDSKFSNETAKLAACVLRYFNQVQFRLLNGKKTPNSILLGVFSHHYSSSSKKVFKTSSIISHSSSVSIGSKSPSVPSSAST